MEKRPRIAITLGDPAGIGPEVVAKALTQPDLWTDVEPYVVGSVNVLDKAFALVGSELRATAVGDTNSAIPNGRVGVISPTAEAPLNTLAYGQVSAVAGDAAVCWARTAGELALGGWVDAITTAPISKEAASLAGHANFGHQEIYQELASAPRVLTMLVTTGLRVVHLTTHHPMHTATTFVTQPGILEALRLTQDFLVQRGFANPRIGVAALNPHNGEAGLIGFEEIEEIRPAVQEAIEAGISASGPVPADTVFGQAVAGDYDVVLAMYHDQGHIAVKMHDWASSLTLNIGLPFLRTSVDHGTAFDIAGLGVADATGMIAAVRYAAETARTGRIPGAV